MSTASAPQTRLFHDGERPADTLTQRKSVAIGDLHGDFYRLTRILEEESILIPGTYAWNPMACNVDLILIGDYVDWRGEPLEGSGDRAADGARRILELLLSLHKQVQALRARYEDFDGRIYCLRGNHDDMMLDALKVLDFMNPSQLEGLMRNHHHYLMRIRGAVMSLGLGGDQLEVMMKFLNWFVQGGKTTLDGWPSVVEWKQSMDGELGDFLRHDLLLGAVVNNRLYAHTAPDLEEFWRPLEELATLAPAEQSRMRESFLWSRRLWGFDYYSGSRTDPFTETELDKMLAGLGVGGVVVGHTPVTTETEPYQAFGGKIINIDLHGIPGSRALVERYDVDPSTVRGVNGGQGVVERILGSAVSEPRRATEKSRRKRRAAAKAAEAAEPAQAAETSEVPSSPPTVEASTAAPVPVEASEAPPAGVSAQTAETSSKGDG